MSKTKQVLVIRKDLNMRRGKEIAQGAHGSCSWLANRLVDHYTSDRPNLALATVGLGASVFGAGFMAGGYWFLLGIVVLFLTTTLSHYIMRSLLKLDPDERDWLLGRFTKVTLQVPGEPELMQVFTAARDAGLKAVLITDSGATEFHGEPTVTCVAIGPHEDERLKPITGGLKLY